LIYLRKDGAKDYKTKVLQDFLRQDGISHEVEESLNLRSNGLAETLHLIIVNKVCCMFIDANLTPNLWPYAEHYIVLIYNSLPHSALDNMTPRVQMMLKLYVFGSICYSLQLSKLYPFTVKHNLG
jgi:hypothetical protein